MNYSLENYENFGLQLIKKYDPETMNFLQWRNEFEFTMKLLDIKHKSYYLIKMLEHSAINFITEHVDPYKPLEVPYDVLMTILQQRYSPHDVYNSLRKRTEYRVQLLGESVESYFNTVKELIYQYHDGPQADNIILKQFIAGLSNYICRETLEAIPNLSLRDALNYAKRMELDSKSLICL